MHANLNKTASKTLLLLLLQKDAPAKKEKRENHEHFCIIYWKFVAHRQWKAWKGDGHRMPKEHAERQNCMKCVSILPCCTACSACPLRLPLPKALSFGLCAFIFHLHEFFIVFPDAKRKRSELHFTLRGISTNTRYLSVGNQLENQLAAQTTASLLLLPPPSYPVA